MLRLYAKAVSFKPISETSGTACSGERIFFSELKVTTAVELMSNNHENKTSNYDLKLV